RWRGRFCPARRWRRRHLRAPQDVLPSRPPRSRPRAGNPHEVHRGRPAGRLFPHVSRDAGEHDASPGALRKERLFAARSCAWPHRPPSLRRVLRPGSLTCAVALTTGEPGPLVVAGYWQAHTLLVHATAVSAHSSPVFWTWLEQSSAAAHHDLT